ncbi:hypothetical protein ACFWC5_00485 [Streptomyces sp. NPDC060085]
MLASVVLVQVNGSARLLSVQNQGQPAIKVGGFGIFYGPGVVCLR